MKYNTKIKIHIYTQKYYNNYKILYKKNKRNPGIGDRRQTTW